MGWNSWDSYGLTITEDQFRQNVAWFNQHLKQFGWKYVVIDEGWYLGNPENANKTGADPGYTMDKYGRYWPASNRFPSTSSETGFQPIADYVHSLGLKFGIHIIRGIPKQAVAQNLPIAGSQFHAADAADTSDLCRWNPDNYGLKDNAAGEAYYNSVARLYAGWGVDFLKVDCISQPYHAAEIHTLSAALRRSGHPIVLSLSPGPTPIQDAADIGKYAQAWRISDDFWDLWTKPDSDTSTFPQTVVRQFAKAAEWATFAGPDHWPDADMLPIGYLGPNPGWGKPRQSRLTAEETKTVVTLWSISRSPLILGANLTRIDSATESLLTNPEVIAVDQQSTENKPVIQTSTAVIWTADVEAGNKYLAVFNRADTEQVIAYDWKALGFPARTYRMRDLWRRKDMGNAPSLSLTLAPHASALLAISAK